VVRDDNRSEVDRNYRAFQAQLPELLKKAPGRFALLHDERIVSIHDRLQDAWREGAARFPDRRFSVQEITNQVADQGCYSHVVRHVFV
jgi:hypothetical protein